MSWRLAKSLTQLRAELKAVYPKRDTRSDGSIADGKHGSTSKHQAGADNIVEAIDIDEDVDGVDDTDGRELWAFVQHLVKLAKAGHPALDGPGAHIIYEGRIWSHARGWVERAYTGENAHLKHVHVATVDGPGKDSTRSWDLAKVMHAGPKPDRWLGLTNPPMRGQDVRNVKDYLRSLGNPELAHDDAYTRDLADVVRIYQNNRGISERGVGPKTWAQIRKEVHR